MNDTSEYEYAKSKFIEAYQNREVWVEEFPRWTANIKLTTHEPATTMMIGSLTEEKDDVGLWDRYAGHGTGCTLGIDAFWLTEAAGVAVRRVSYDTDYLKDFVNSGLSMLQSAFEDNPDNRHELEELASMLVFDLYAFKDPRFRSEREVRISRLTVTDDTMPFGLRDVGGHKSDGTHVPALPIQQRQSQHGPIRFLELPLENDSLGFAIKSVCFGPSINPDSEASIKELVSEYSGIELSNSDIPLR
ncbi:hypothetical protein GCM10022404_23320 [Celeribacter arenosi]|uniref:DUF2971 domain-containing protein n=2 Tax=Celeribacter arenosi TaxID=792649 RepID=A0ABP7KDY4_9RHOB